jgi:DNA-binding NtrC family response regulator
MDDSRLTKRHERIDAPVLIVEDDADLRATLTEILESEGHTVLVAESVPSAREILARVRPAAVLLDLRLQGESSESLLAELCAVTNPQATVVLSGSKKGAELATEYGVVSVSKPFDVDTLVKLINRAAANGVAMLDAAPNRRTRSDKAG